MSYGVSSRDSQTRSDAPSGRMRKTAPAAGPVLRGGCRRRAASADDRRLGDGDRRDLGGDAGDRHRGAGVGCRRACGAGAAGRRAAHGRGVDVAVRVDAQRADLVVARVEQHERLARGVDPEHAARRLGAGEQPALAIEGQRHRVRGLGLVERRALAVGRDLVDDALVAGRGEHVAARSTTRLQM